MPFLFNRRNNITLKLDAEEEKIVTLKRLGTFKRIGFTNVPKREDAAIKLILEYASEAKDEFKVIPDEEGKCVIDVDALASFELTGVISTKLFVKNLLEQELTISMNVTYV